MTPGSTYAGWLGAVCAIHLIHNVPLGLKCDKIYYLEHTSPLFEFLVALPFCASGQIISAFVPKLPVLYVTIQAGIYGMKFINQK